MKLEKNKYRNVVSKVTLDYKYRNVVSKVTLDYHKMKSKIYVTTIYIHMWVDR